eukprot:SAG31_NODE_4579_length_3121_cov_1.314692_2_plen_79_part_00
MRNIYIYLKDTPPISSPRTDWRPSSLQPGLNAAPAALQLVRRLWLPSNVPSPTIDTFTRPAPVISACDRNVKQAYNLF